MKEKRKMLNLFEYNFNFVRQSDKEFGDGSDDDSLSI